MKICPTCQGTYTDNIAFCTRDGAALKVTTTWAEGTIVRGRYRILGKIGEGGMGEVYKALHTGFDELRAIKVISSDLVRDETFVKRFKHEAFITRKLQHPNAVRVDDIDEAEDGRPFMVMEYIEGHSLQKLIDEGGPMPAMRVCTITKQVLAALDAAHHLGMVHRDIKPDNIVLVNAPEGEQAKVLDFGIAKIKEARHQEVAAGTLTGLGVTVGTPQYMSPEQAMGKRGDELDARSDLYSLGVVMYEMLTGELPFKATASIDFLLAHMQKLPRPVFLVRPDVKIPDSLASLVMRTLQKKRELRPQSAAALIEEIIRVEKGLPLSTLRVGVLSAPSGGQAQAAGAVPDAKSGASAGSVVAEPPVAQTKSAPPTPVLEPVTLPTSPATRSGLAAKAALIVVIAATLGWVGWYFATHRRAALIEQHRAEGEALAKKLLFPQAELEYRAAAELDPQNGSLRLSLGNVLTQERKWDDAILAYREAQRLKPDDPEVHNNLAVCLQTAGRVEGAIPEYRAALSLNPDYLEAHLNLGDALEKLRDSEGAIGEFREVLRRKPDDADALYRLGMALNKRGDVDGAIAQLREAIRVKPGFAFAHFALGGVLYNRGDTVAGLDEFRTAYNLAPDNPEIRAAYQKLLEK